MVFCFHWFGFCECRCANDLRNRYYSAKRAAKRARSRKSDDTLKRPKSACADEESHASHRFSPEGAQHTSDGSAGDLEILARFADADSRFSAEVEDAIAASKPDVSLRYEAYEALLMNSRSKVPKACALSAAEIAESDDIHRDSSHVCAPPTITVPHNSVVITQSDRVDAEATPTKPPMPQPGDKPLPAWFLSTVSPLLTSAL